MEYKGFVEQANLNERRYALKQYLDMYFVLYQFRETHADITIALLEVLA